MSKVNSQSQSGTSSHASPLLPGGLLAPNTLSSRNRGENEFENEGLIQPVDNEAFTKRAKVRVHADQNSNAQGQSQITQADWADLTQVVIPVGVQVEND